MSGLENIVYALCTLESSEKVRELVNELLSKGAPVADILGSLRDGLDCVGKKYEAGEFFLSELLYSAALANDVLGILRPSLESEKVQRLGTIVLGTVKGDVHDIGKNIFKMFAQGAGFEVYDLGKDIPPEQFLTKTEEMNANIVGASALLSTTLPIQREIVQKITAAGLRGKVKVIFGGAPVTQQWVQEIGGDGYGESAVEAVNIAKKLLMIES